MAKKARQYTPHETKGQLSHHFGKWKLFRGQTFQAGGFYLVVQCTNNFLCREILSCCSVHEPLDGETPIIQTERYNRACDKPLSFHNISTCTPDDGTFRRVPFPKAAPPASTPSNAASRFEFGTISVATPVAVSTTTIRTEHQLPAKLAAAEH